MTDIDPDNEIALREFYDRSAEYIQKMYDAGTTYNQVIVLAGYAAFFAVWSATAEDLPRWVVLASGASIIISVIVYVAWSVANMVILKTANINMVNAINGGPIGFYERVSNAEEINRNASNRLMRLWAPVTVIASFTGGIAAVLVCVSALYRVYEITI